MKGEVPLVTATLRLVLLPTHIAVVPENTAAVGVGFTVTDGAPLGVVAVQPFASVTEVKPKVVVLAGETAKLAALT